MKSLLRAFFENWGLKFLALVLAIVIYYSMRDSIHTSRYPGQSSFIKGPSSHATDR